MTDVTNASRTLLMDLRTLDWDDELLSFFGIPREMLPEIKPSSYPESYGITRDDGPMAGQVPITGILGDQQAAMVGQVCLDAGEAKNTATSPISSGVPMRPMGVRRASFSASRMPRAESMVMNSVWT